MCEFIHASSSCDLATKRFSQDAWSVITQILGRVQFANNSKEHCLLIKEYEKFLAVICIQ